MKRISMFELPSAYLLSEQMFRQLWDREADSLQGKDRFEAGWNSIPDLRADNDLGRIDIQRIQIIVAER